MTMLCRASATRFGIVKTCRVSVFHSLVMSAPLLWRVSVIASDMLRFCRASVSIAWTSQIMPGSSSLMPSNNRKDCRKLLSVASVAVSRFLMLCRNARYLSSDWKNSNDVRLMMAVSHDGGVTPSHCSVSIVGFLLQGLGNPLGHANLVRHLTLQKVAWNDWGGTSVHVLRSTTLFFLCELVTSTVFLGILQDLYSHCSSF
mmetsp:Transcript_24266/g.53410  ORF Transcript_24266/g.53410 Transcript_24266/m.53410 type:complete len:201 (+) Transcript_24266:117-719(+)